MVAVNALLIDNHATDIINVVFVIVLNVVHVMICVEEGEDVGGNNV